MTNRHVVGTTSSPITDAYALLEKTELPEDIDLIDVAQAVPGYPPPDELLAHLNELDPVPLSKYGAVLGDPELREATANDISTAYGATVDAANVGITAGANQAFCLAALALCEPGDEVITPLPYYFNHDMWLQMNGVNAVYVSCGPDMLPDIEEVAGAITEHTRAIALVTPNNPTGRVYPPDQIMAYFRLAASNGIALILDETYRDFRPTTEPPHALFEDPCWDDTLIHIASFSKVFSITGYRVGAIAASESTLEHIDKIADCLTICPNRIGQAAALYGLRNLGDWVEGNRTLMNARVDQFTTLMTESQSPFEVVSAGAYFAYVRHPFNGTSAREVMKHLVADQAVLALAGNMFGSDQRSYLRLAFANLDTSGIPALVDRLGQVRPEDQPPVISSSSSTRRTSIEP